eukprot:scaffold95230_cov20-Prasinocladus_malaysianus.AAC.1
MPLQAFGCRLTFHEQECHIDEEEIIQEKRVRVLMGIKRYFHAKRTEGLISSHGLRILNEAVDLSMDRPVSAGSGPLAASP